MPSQNLIAGTSGTTQPESEYMFVVYDKGSGKIHHIHHVINMPGAEVKDRDQMERVAQTCMGEAQRTTAAPPAQPPSGGPSPVKPRGN